ncbi:MAG: efflux RND transporter periplasmic adaptor subunit [Gammaproteobacteria bacterium]|nr:efflux RND transporter periplasmic adaptor subunit [Gammaproteobacteria bacterium]
MLSLKTNVKHEINKKSDFSAKSVFLTILLAVTLASYVNAESQKHDHKEHDVSKYSENAAHQHDDHESENDEVLYSEKDDHSYEVDNEAGHGHEEIGLVKLTAEQQQMADIKVETVAIKKNINQIISAPGEVVNDLYHTTLLSTQVNSKVLSRQIVLGQHVKKGDVIAVLYSIDIATAQSQLKLSTAEWQRARKLGKKTVGEKRFIAARTDFEKDKSRLLAYGLNRNLLQQFLAGKNPYKSGQYPVLAPHDGVILEDNFQSGQYLPAGSAIALLVNEDQVWIEALLAPEIGQHIPVGTNARVVFEQKTFNARVIHDSHAIDEITRTRKIRLSIENKDHLLHAGLFARVLLELPIEDQVILLPETALMRSSDGDWIVFIEQQSGIFQQKEVELTNTINGLHNIKGLKVGERVAIKGAFFLASEMAKGGFDPHNH